MTSTATIRARICLAETEESWDKIAGGLEDLKGLVRDDGSPPSPELLPLLRSTARNIIASMQSERTRLSGVAIDSLTVVACGLGSDFEPLIPILFPAILSLCARTNKVTVTRARELIVAIIENTQSASCLTYFLNNIKDKATSLRLACADGTLSCLNSLNPSELTKENRAKEIEAITKSIAKDANADVRRVGKKVFEAYTQLFPNRVVKFSDPLSPTMKKYLGISKAAPAPVQRATGNVHSTTAKLVPPPRPNAKLSSSTSAVPTTSSTDNRPQAHVRSNSSSAVQSKVKEAPIASSESTAGKRLSKAVGQMPPPDFVPMRSGPTRVATAARGDERVRTTSSRSDSNPSRPGSAQSNSTAASGTSAPSRPRLDRSEKPHSSTAAGPSRRGPVRIPSSRKEDDDKSDKVLNLARRIPLPDDEPRKGRMVDNISSTSSLQGPRRAPAIDRPNSASDVDRPVLTRPPDRFIAAQRKPPIPIIGAGKPTKALAGEKQETVKSVGSAPSLGAATSQVTQPKAQIQQKEKKTAPKPVWGSKPAPSKNVPVRAKPPVAANEHRGASTKDKKAKPTVTASEPQAVAEEVPLPRSPSPVVTEHLESEVIPNTGGHEEPPKPAENVETPVVALVPTAPVVEVALESEGDNEIVEPTTPPTTIPAEVDSSTDPLVTSVPKRESEALSNSRPNTSDDASKPIAGPKTPLRSAFAFPSTAKTPISLLVASIEAGFRTPPSAFHPLSPNSSFLNQPSVPTPAGCFPFPIDLDVREAPAGANQEVDQGTPTPMIPTESHYLFVNDPDESMRFRAFASAGEWN